MKKIMMVLIALSSLSVFPILAAQQYDVEDGTLVQSAVSNNAMSRLAIKSGKILKIWGDTALMEYTKDDAKGEIFFKPRRPGVAFSFFVSDDTGATYTINAKPAEMPSQVIFLNAIGKPVKKTLAHHKDAPHVKSVKGLMNGMVNNADMPEYRVQKTNNIVNMWDEVAIKRIRVFTGYNLEGEVLTLKNASKDVMRLHESEFFGMHEHTSAVSILDLELQPDQMTIVYVIHSI